jgi:hypothetical protein
MICAKMVGAKILWVVLAGELLEDIFKKSLKPAQYAFQDPG